MLFLRQEAVSSGQQDSIYPQLMTICCSKVQAILTQVLLHWYEENWYNVSLTWTHKIDRGSHFFWLRKGTLDTRPDHIINQIHYEVMSCKFISVICLVMLFFLYLSYHLHCDHNCGTWVYLPYIVGTFYNLDLTCLIV